MAKCDPPVLELNDCDNIDYGYTDGDMDVWLGAWLIRETARCLAETGKCADAYKCSNGKFGLGVCNGDAPEGIVIGELPAVTGDCCGSITVAARYPNLIENNDGCYTRFDVTYDLKLTWPCTWSKFLITCEISRFRRLFNKVLCCKWPADDKASCGGKNAQITGVEDEPIGDDCPSVVFNIQLSK